MTISRRVFAQTDFDRGEFFVESEVILGKYYYVKILFESSETGNFCSSRSDYVLIAQTNASKFLL